MIHYKGNIFLKDWVNLRERERALFSYGLMLQLDSQPLSGGRLSLFFKRLFRAWLKRVYGWQILKAVSYCKLPLPWRFNYIGEILLKHEILREKSPEEIEQEKQESKEDDAAEKIKQYNELILEISYKTGATPEDFKQGIDHNQIEDLIKVKEKVDLQERMKRVVDQHSKPDEHYKALVKDLRELTNQMRRHNSILEENLDPKVRAKIEEHIRQHNEQHDPNLV